MATNKTQQTDEDPADFLNTIENPTVREDCFKILTMLEEQSGLPARMWGTSMIGVGSYHYRYASGHQGDMFLAGFSPRKQQISLYLTLPSQQRDQFLAILGKHKSAVSCIYIKKLADIDENVLRAMIDASIQYLLQTYPAES